MNEELKEGELNKEKLKLIASDYIVLIFLGLNFLTYILFVIKLGDPFLLLPIILSLCAFFGVLLHTLWGYSLALLTVIISFFEPFNSLLSDYFADKPLDLIYNIIVPRVNIFQILYSLLLVMAFIFCAVRLFKLFTQQK